MLERRRWRISPGHVQEFCDVLQAIQTVLHLTTSRGDAVVIHTPCYPPFLDTLKSMGLDLVAVPALRTDAGWGFDHDELDRQLTARAGGNGGSGGSGGRAKVLLLCNPHNPTGHVFTPAELRQLSNIAQRHDLVIVSDEVHADLVHAPHRHTELAVVAPEVEARTVTISSASKAFNLAGVRWACAHVGSAPLRHQLRNLPGHLLGVPNLLGVEASRAAWTDPAADAWLAACVAQIGRNRERLATLLDEHLPAIDYSPGEATYLAWLDCRAVDVEGSPHEAFRRAGVETTPGQAFGPGGDGFVRANVATSGSVLTALVQRMSIAVAPR
jgi:cystathionine beta-lyase